MIIKPDCSCQALVKYSQVTVGAFPKSGAPWWHNVLPSKASQIFEGKLGSLSLELHIAICIHTYVCVCVLDKSEKAFKHKQSSLSARKVGDEERKSFLTLSLGSLWTWRFWWKWKVQLWHHLIFTTGMKSNFFARLGQDRTLDLPV